jgi:prepilin-type N-terminal cleavage/methylation domain-containing protein
MITRQVIKTAFTLIELLVVIAIIGILSGLIVVTMSGVTQKATIAKSQVFSNSLRNALMLNLVSEWRFDGSGVADGGTATTAYTLDSWGSNGCTVVSTPKVSSSCVNGSCLLFTKSNVDSLNCGTMASSSAGTMSAWIKPSGYGVVQIIMAGLNSSGADVSARYLMGAIHSSGCSGNWYTSLGNGSTSQYACSGEAYNSTNFPAGVWVYLVVTYDGSNVKFYKNGTLINTVAQTVSGAGDAQPFYVGRGGAYYGLSFDGYIDEARVFSAAIPTSQIKEQYYAGLNSLLINSGISKEEYSLRIIKYASN